MQSIKKWLSNFLYKYVFIHLYNTQTFGHGKLFSRRWYFIFTWGRSYDQLVSFRLTLNTGPRKQEWIGKGYIDGETYTLGVNVFQYDGNNLKKHIPFALKKIDHVKNVYYVHS